MATKIVNAKEARSHLEEIIDLAEQGNETLISRNGKIVARIIPAYSKQMLDLDELHKFRKSTSKTPLAVNGVLLAREEARY